MEHGSYDLETVQDMIRSSADAGITPIVRVGELLYSLVARLLDSGAQGIVLPRVEDPGAAARSAELAALPAGRQTRLRRESHDAAIRSAQLPRSDRASESQYARGGAVRDRAPPWSAPTSCSR